MNFRQNLTLYILAAALFLMVAALNARISVPGDFRAFYCAGAAVGIGADPYRVEPLRTCERTGDIHGRHTDMNFVIPAPLPGYALAPFVVLAKIPYENAVVLWRCALWIAVLITAAALWKLTGTDILVVTAALLFSSGYPAATGGNIAPFAIAGLALGAWFASRRRYAPAVLGVLLAMWEPHLGLGALAALILFVPAARLYALTGTCVLGALTYATTGLAWTQEYLHAVVPAHILAEIGHEKQFSLTHLAHFLGAPEHTAVILGELSYIAALSIGLIAARRLHAKLQDDACFILIPTAFTLIGGPFMHIFQIAAALPAAFFLHAKAPQLARPLSWAVLLLAVPWVEAATLKIVEPFMLLSFGFLAWNLLNDRRSTALAVAAASLLFLVISSLPISVPLPVLHVPGTALSEDGWKPIVDTMFAHTAWFFPFQLLTWAGLLITAWAAIRASQPQPDGSLYSGK